MTIFSQIDLSMYSHRNAERNAPLNTPFEAPNTAVDGHSHSAEEAFNAN